MIYIKRILLLIIAFALWIVWIFEFFMRFITSFLGVSIYYVFHGSVDKCPVLVVSVVKDYLNFVYQIKKRLL